MTPQARTTRFLVDSTAARLSRWLRFLGYDAVLDRSRSDAVLLARARREGRALLTRKRVLGTSPGAAGGVLLLSSDFVSDQLRQVASDLGLKHDSPPRCTVCNSELSPVTRAEVDGRVPEFVYRTRDEFAFCRRCDRYYWKGTHWENAARVSSAALSARQERSRS